VKEGFVAFGPGDRVEDAGQGLVFDFDETDRRGGGFGGVGGYGGYGLADEPHAVGGVDGAVGKVEADVAGAVAAGNDGPNAGRGSSGGRCRWR
jgi:hypothetical protein